MDEIVTQQILEMAFIPFGEITLITIPKDTFTQKHRGFAFIEFESADDASHALYNMHNSVLYGKVLKINYAKPHSLSRGKGVWEVEEALVGAPVEK